MQRIAALINQCLTGNKEDMERRPFINLMDQYLFCYERSEHRNEMMKRQAGVVCRKLRSTELVDHLI